MVLTGIPETGAQSLVLAINETLGSEVMDTSNPRMLRQGNATEVRQLVADMNAGQVGAIIVAGVNPVYSLPFSEEFVGGLAKVDLKVAFSMKKDETALLCDFVAATPHYLESWGDVQFTRKNYTLMQPTIRPLFDTSQFQDTLLRWTDNDNTYYEYIKETWKDALGTTSWIDALHDGAFEASEPEGISSTVTAGPTNVVVNDDTTAARNLAGAATQGL